MKNVNDMTRDELRAEAKELQIPGRGSMKVDALREAVRQWRGTMETVHEALTARSVKSDWTEVGTTSDGGRVFVAPFGTPEPTHRGHVHMAPLPAKRDRYRDRVKRGELKVRTPNGQAPDIFLSPVAVARRTPRSVPMSTKTRTMHYVKQNGGALTPRQARQVMRMERRGAPAQ